MRLFLFGTPKALADGPAPFSSMSPTGFSRTLHVDSAGPDAPAMARFTTIRAALADAGANTAAKAKGPQLWQRIIVTPGTYNERVQPPQYVAIIGDTTDPADVLIAADENGPGDAYRAVFNSEGTSSYLANCTVRYTGLNEFWHPLRDGGYGNYPTPRLVLCENVSFEVRDDAPVDCQVLDMHPGSNTAYIFNECTLIGRNLPNIANVVSAGDPGPVPGVCAFVDCHVEGNKLTWVNNAVNVYNLDYIDARMIGLLETGGATRVDALIWIGGSFDTGTATGTPGVSKPAKADIWIESGNTPPITKWYIDPSVTNFEERTTAVGYGIRTVATISNKPVHGVTPSAAEYAGN